MPVKDIELVKMTTWEFGRLRKIHRELLFNERLFDRDDTIEIYIGHTRIIEGERWWVLKELRELIAKVVIKD